MGTRDASSTPREELERLGESVDLVMERLQTMFQIERILNQVHVCHHCKVQKERRYLNRAGDRYYCQVCWEE